jgi:hypothetical protein
MGTVTVADLRATRWLFAAALAILVAGTALAADCSDPSGPDWFWGLARGVLTLLLVYGGAKLVEVLLSALGTPDWGNAVYPLLFIGGPMLVLYAYADVAQFFGTDAGRAYGFIAGLHC